MATFPGLYRAKAVKIEAQKLTVQIPQVYGEASVTVTEFIGGVPTTVGMGYVSFRSGDAAFPVWHGGGGGGGAGTVTDTLWVGPDAPTAESGIEMWWDTDDDVDLDPRYATPAYVAQRTTKRWTAAGVALTTQAVATETTVITLSVPAQPIAGDLFVAAMVRYDKTVATDQHIIRIRDGGTEIVNWYSGAGTLNVTPTLTCSIPAPINTARTITATIIRSGGTGTISSYATAINDRIDALWFPA